MLYPGRMALTIKIGPASWVGGLYSLFLLSLCLSLYSHHYYEDSEACPVIVVFLNFHLCLIVNIHVRQLMITEGG